MRISVKAKPGAKIEKIKRADNPLFREKGELAAHFEIWVKEPPREGKANYAIQEKLAEFFGVPFSDVQLISGRTGKQKVFEIKRG